MTINVIDWLKEKDISFKSFEHPAVYTCDEAKQQRVYTNIRGIHSKNLFLKDRKSRRFFLVVIPEEKRADLNGLGIIVGEKLKFANETDLKNFLGLSVGSVSPFGLLNDSDHKVELLVDKDVWNSEYVSFHPNVNTETLELLGADFQKYVKLIGNKYIII